MNLIVLYPQPKNPEKFESDYSEHIKLLHDKRNISLDSKLITNIGQNTFNEVIIYALDEMKMAIEKSL